MIACKKNLRMRRHALLQLWERSIIVLSNEKRRSRIIETAPQTLAFLVRRLRETQSLHNTLLFLCRSLKKLIFGCQCQLWEKQAKDGTRRTWNGRNSPLSAQRDFPALSLFWGKRRCEEKRLQSKNQKIDLGSSETRITCPALSSAASFVFAQPGSFPTENLDNDVSYFCAFQ